MERRRKKGPSEYVLRSNSKKAQVDTLAMERRTEVGTVFVDNGLLDISNITYRYSEEQPGNFLDSEVPNEVETVVLSMVASLPTTVSSNDEAAEASVEAITTVPEDDSSVFYSASGGEARDTGSITSSYSLRSRTSKRNAADDGISTTGQRIANNKGTPPGLSLPEWVSSRSNNSVRRRQNPKNVKRH